MRFLADECLARTLVEALRDDGHDVEIIDGLHSGADDRTVLERATRNGQVLMTEDKGFGELVVRLGLPTVGIVVIDLARMPSERRASRLLTAISGLEDGFEGRIGIIEPHRTRVRNLQVD